MKLSLDNPPQVGDVFTYNGMEVVEIDCYGYFRAYVKESNSTERFLCAAFYGLEVTRPAKKVTGELKCILDVDSSCIPRVAVHGSGLNIEQFLTPCEDGRYAIIKLEDN